jgi:DNA-binding transcriptional LysR family regulator
VDHRRLAALDLNLLVVLDALLTERRVGAAGRRVGLSQPATSHALARLRDLLGDPLLLRSGRQMLLTPRAVAVAPAVRRLLNGALTLFDERAGFDPADSTRTFTIAAADYVERLLLVPLIAALREEAPRAGFVLRPAVASEIPRAETGDVDLGVTSLSGEAPGLRRRRLWTDPYVVALRRAHPLLQSAQGRRTRLTPAQHAALPHVRVSPEGQGTSQLDDALERSGLRRTIVYRTPSFASALAVVAASDLVATVPARALTAFGEGRDLVALPVTFIAPLAIDLLRHERYAEDPALDWLAAHVLRAAAALSHASA